MKYLDEFLQLRCAGDVLNAVAPLNNAAKEITEAMAIINRIRKIALKQPMEYTLIDLCSGNALIPIISVCLLPVKESFAIDREPRHRKGHANIDRFTYHEADIMNEDFIIFLSKLCFDRQVILTACHPCGSLSRRIASLYNSIPNITHLVLMPCCNGRRVNLFPHAVEEKLGSYLAWSYDLAIDVDGNLVIDLDCLSPKNAIIIAEKG